MLESKSRLCKSELIVDCGVRPLLRGRLFLFDEALEIALQRTGNQRIRNVCMFVRFKRRKLRAAANGAAEYSLHAVLVENNRQKGHSRQRIIKYLGSIREADFDDAISRKRFFHSILRKLNHLNIDPAARAKIEVRLGYLFLQKSERRSRSDRRAAPVTKGLKTWPPTVFLATGLFQALVVLLPC
jgi:hypothetical protein